MINNIKKYLLLAVITASSSLYSCKDYLETSSPSRIDQKVVFESADNTNSALMGIYSKVAGRFGYGQHLSFQFGMGGDDFWSRGGNPYDRNNVSAVTTFNPSTNNGALLSTFNQLYEGIERANIACKEIPNSTIYNTGSTEQRFRMRNYYGEALTLRALFYFELIRNWGDVPASFVPAADRSDLFLGHSDRDSTYDRILDDLKLASELVAWRSDLSSYKTFRFTKGAVKALRARIALFRGGYSLRTDTKLMQRKDDYLKYYKIAFDECNDVIKSKQHQLNPSFENLFKTLHSGTARFDESNELMFEVAMWGNINDGDLARSFGLEFRNSTYGAGGGGPRAVPTYFYEFAKGVDSRRDVTLVTYNVQNATNSKMQATIINLGCGKYRKSWTQFDASSPSLTFGVNFPAIRYADVLLMYAEAANELNDNSGALSKLDALQLVQKRAYGVNPLPTTPLDQKGFFDAIVKERLLEFGGESIRRYDLIRWNKLDETIKAVGEKLKLLAWGAPTADNPYANISQYVYYRPTTFTNKTYPEENASLSLYGGSIDKVLYEMNTVNPGGTYTRINWRNDIGTWTNGVLTGNLYNVASQGWGTFFQANSRELLPYPGRVILESRGAIKQNFGYTD